MYQRRQNHMLLLTGKNGNIWKFYALLFLSQFTQMAEYVSQFFMLLAMIPWGMNPVQRDGVQCKVSRRFCSQLYPCLQVR